MAKTGKRKRVFKAASALLFATTLLLTACGSGSKNANGEGAGTAAETAQENPLAGNYAIVETTGADGLTPETVEIMKMNDLTISLTIEEDGSGILDLFGETTALSVDATDMQMTMDDQTYPITVEGDKLTIRQENGDMIFQRG